MSSTKVFDKLLETATSPLSLEVDWESILKMCDLIRQGDVQAKYAIGQVKKKLNSENINSVNFSLQCIESMVKNCGSKVHQEVATREFMDSMRNVALTKPDPIKAKILELIQCWNHAFKKNPNYRVVEDYFNSMKLEGFQFAVLKESEAMFEVEEAPAWKEDQEANSCLRCKSEFSILKRRHHCRACGQIFCHNCSSKTATLPQYGYEKEVRVCDLCYEKSRGSSGLPVNPAMNLAMAPNGELLPVEYLNSPLFKESVVNTNKKPAEKSEQEFEEELQLALALSQSEAEAKESSKKKKNQTSFNQVKEENKKWQQGSAQTNASAPSIENYKASKSNENIEAQPASSSSHNEEEEKINKEIDEFVEELKKTLEIFINRMKSDSMRGRSITNDTAVQSLFLQLQHLQPKLMSYIKYQEDARAYYENLQDKLTQLKDAREALNALRQENYEKKRREMEEKERLRQTQISQKLHHMRQQKQSYYQFQNQLNLQRLQLQERDLQLRLEQQRQLVMKRDQQLLSANGLPMPVMSNEPAAQMAYQMHPNMSMTMPGYSNPNPVYVDSYQMNPSMLANNPNMPPTYPQQQTHHMMQMPVDPKLQQYQQQQQPAAIQSGQLPQPEHYMAQQQATMQYGMAQMPMNNQLYAQPQMPPPQQPQQQQQQQQPAGPAMQQQQQQTYAPTQPSVLVQPQYQPAANVPPAEVKSEMREAQLISFD